MELALYHPEFGYYLSPAPRAGKQGDFLTSPELSPFFGRVIGRQLHEVWNALGAPAEFTVIEYGAGGGRLAHDVLTAAWEEAPAFASAARYVLHEFNAHRRDEAAALLEAAGFAAQCAFEGPGGAPAAVQAMAGCVVTNEFIDALPVHRALWRAGALRERYVVWRDDWFTEELDVPSTPRLQALLEEEGIELAEGQHVDVILAAGDWLCDAAARLSRGAVLTIDYGYPSAEMYAPRHHAGTFLCYYQHTANEEPFARVGRQDMTAHVDFGLLSRAGARAGLATLGETTQGAFLANFGLGDILVASQGTGRELAEYLVDRTAVFAMIDPRGMGGFRVLLQGKGVTLDAPRGFTGAPG